MSSHALEPPRTHPENAPLRDASGPSRELRLILGLCILIAAIRLVSLALYPVIDRTESRYAEIARTMAASDDWVMPTLLGQPFWGKPPLSTWCQAASIELFGVNEFAVRFPAWLLTVLAACLVWHAARLWLDRTRAWLATAAFCAGPLAIGMAGAVMTDPYLGFGLTLSLFALARWCQRDPDRPPAWSTALLFAGGLAFGTLAKGPIAVVFGGAPLLALCATRNGRAALRGWPWARAILAFLALTAPWFLAAEARTPGFLEYFFIGEHWHRFTQPDWKGDRYGGTHPTTRGTVWLYFAVSFGTWVPAIVLAVGRRGARAKTGPDAFVLALWASVLTPLVLFTFARSVLPPYVFPAIPAASLLVSRKLEPFGARCALTIIGVLCIVLVVAVPFVPDGVWASHGHRELVQDLDCDTIVYCRTIETIYSAHFYSRGRIVASRYLGDNHWAEFRKRPDRVRIATKDRELLHIPPDVLPRLSVEREFGAYQLWRID